MRLLLALLCVSSAAAHQSSGFQIAGQVVRSSHNPVHSAHVSIFIPQHPENKLSVLTGENGDFSFRDLAPGKYSLQVTDHGQTQLYKEYQGFNTAIAVGRGLDSEHIVFELQPTAQIVGSVLDDAGDPVRNANVYLFAQWIYHGTPTTGQRQTKTTASDGSFHFTHLEPGTYFVVVAGRPWYAQAIPPTSIQDWGHSPAAVANDALDVTFPLTYYPNATSADSATPIELKPGDRSELHFVMRPVHGLRISLEGFSTAPEHRIVPMLRAIGPGGTAIDVPVGWSPEPALIGVPPGTYLVSSDSFEKNQMSSLGSQIVDFTADTTLRLSDAVKTTVKGKLIFVGDTPQTLVVLLEGIGNTNDLSASVMPDGSFDMGDLPPGRYNLSLANAPLLYMDSVTVKGGAYAKGVLQVEQGSQIELIIKVSEGVGQIEGVAMRDGQPATAAMVLAVPQDWRHGNYIPRDQSDSDGTFTLSSVPPGRYKVVAIEDGRGLAYANPDVIQPYLEQAALVTVTATKNAKLQVEVLPRY